MPFTVALVQAIFGALVALLALSFMKLHMAAEFFAHVAVWLAVVAVPVFLLEALGFLNAAATWLFGRRPPG